MKTKVSKGLASLTDKIKYSAMFLSRPSGRDVTLEVYSRVSEKFEYVTLAALWTKGSFLTPLQFFGAHWEIESLCQHSHYWVNYLTVSTVDGVACIYRFDAAFIGSEWLFLPTTVRGDRDMDMRLKAAASSTCSN